MAAAVIVVGKKSIHSFYLIAPTLSSTLSYKTCQDLSPYRQWRTTFSYKRDVDNFLKSRLLCGNITVEAQNNALCS